MATITNNTKYTLTGPPTGKDKRCKLIGPGKSLNCPDKAARTWRNLGTNAEFIKRGQVIVRLDKTHGAPAAKGKPAAPPKDEPTTDEERRANEAETLSETPNVEDDGSDGSDQEVVVPDLVGMHWRTACSAVANIDNLEALEKLHEAEERGAVLKAIEERMAELQE